MGAQEVARRTLLRLVVYIAANPSPSSPQSNKCQKRRQQLRLAQRAYRDRKENTIISLQKKVDDLTGQIEQINQSFIDFSDRLLESNVLADHPNLVESLGSLTRQCISLAQDIYDSENDDSSQSQKTQSVITEDSDKGKTEDPPKDTRVLVPVSEAPNTDYSNTMQSKWRKAPTRTSNYPNDADHGSPDESRTVASIVESPSPDSGIQPPFFVAQSPPIDTVRIDFIRNLVQHCCRGAYNLLSNPNANTRRVEHVFGSIPVYQARNTMISSLYYVSFVGEKNDVAQRANVLASLRENLTKGSMEYSQASARAWDIAFGTVSGTEWLDAGEVLKLLVARGVQARGNDLFIPIQHANLRLNSQSAFLFDMATFIKGEGLANICISNTDVSIAISIRAVCLCPGPAFKRRDVENVLEFLATNYETINRPPI